MNADKSQNLQANLHSEDQPSQTSSNSKFKLINQILNSPNKIVFEAKHPERDLLTVRPELRKYFQKYISRIKELEALGADFSGIRLEVQENEGNHEFLLINDGYSLRESGFALDLNTANIVRVIFTRIGEDQHFITRIEPIEVSDWNHFSGTIKNMLEFTIVKGGNRKVREMRMGEFLKSTGSQIPRIEYWAKKLEGYTNIDRSRELSILATQIDSAVIELWKNYYRELIGSERIVESEEDTFKTMIPIRIFGTGPSWDPIGNLIAFDLKTRSYVHRISGVSGEEYYTQPWSQYIEVEPEIIQKYGDDTYLLQIINLLLMMKQASEKEA